MTSQPRQGPLLPPLLLPSFPGAALLLTSPDVPGGKLIVKLKPEGAQEPPRAQTIILTGAPAGWPPPRRDGAPVRLQLAAGIRTILLSKASEEPGPRETPPARAPPTSDPSASCTSKGVYENYRRWQCYKALARQHFPGTPDAEALACFFIPVLRSLTRLRPELALEEGVPRAVQEWERSSNFERMIFYEMAEKFMEFEAEEELQIQKMKLLSSSQFQPPTTDPPKLSGPPALDVGQQQVYIPKKAASKGRQPRRRQRHLPGPVAPGEPREIPPEAVRQYTEIMEGLRPSWEEEAGGRGEPQSQAQGTLPDPALLQYVEQLCEDESFVCKVEAVIHPQFLAQLLSPEKRCDPLDLSEELEQELGLTPSQLVEKRLLALSEDELSPLACPAPHSDSTPSQSEEEDEGSSQKGPASRRQAMSGASPPRGSGAKGRALGAERPEVPTPTPVRPSQPRQWQPGDAAALRCLSPRKCGGEGRLLASLRSRVERVSQQPQGQGQDRGRREGSAVTLGTIQPGSQAWSVRSQGDNLVGPANHASTPSGYKKQDGGQEGKVKSQSEANADGEGLRDAPMGTKCCCQGDNLVEAGALESGLNGHGQQDGCQGETVKGQPQAGWEPLGDIPSATGQANIVRSHRDNLMEQRALESTFNGHGKQDGGLEGKVRGQNKEEADWSEATLRERDLQPGSMKLSGNNLKREGSPASTPTRPGERDGSQAGQPTKLESRVGGDHPTVLLLSRANGQPLSLFARPLGADGRGEGELPPVSNVQGQRPDPPPLGLSGLKGPTQARAALEADSSCRAEPEWRFAIEMGSRQPHLLDGGNSEGNGVRTMAGPGDPEQCEAGATRGCGNGTSSRDDGKEAGEASSAMGDGPSKMVTIASSEFPPEGMEDAGKHDDDEEDDEELSIFSSLLASKLHLSSPEGPVGSVPALRDQVGPHSRALSPTWETVRWDPMRRRSTRLCPDGSHAMDTGVRLSHKRRSNNMAARRSKRLRSQ
ncbi:NUT family member 1 [Malaclemys terrapin pileata]|uniref:NUT family member 1 n=1 Tax=Malaclemys terrapin pileata TaxID=2991368 RepID=UPI0023A83573|nr:NUT family member 1 [Malaclemys terrapin pileata]